MNIKHTYKSIHTNHEKKYNLNIKHAYVPFIQIGRHFKKIKIKNLNKNTSTFIVIRILILPEKSP